MITVNTKAIRRDLMMERKSIGIRPVEKDAYYDGVMDALTEVEKHLKASKND